MLLQIYILVMPVLIVKFIYWYKNIFVIDKNIVGRYITIMNDE